MAARNYYQEARRLAWLLNEDGLPHWATTFEEAINGGFTATEILMALRWHAQQFQKAPLHLSAETSRQLERLLAGLDEVLESPC